MEIPIVVLKLVVAQPVPEEGKRKGNRTYQAWKSQCIIDLVQHRVAAARGYLSCLLLSL